MKFLSLLKIQLVENGTKKVIVCPAWLEVLANQIFDSAIVGGIAWLTTFVVSGNVSLLGFAVGFGLTFLIKLKDYRNIRD